MKGGKRSQKFDPSIQTLDKKIKVKAPGPLKLSLKKMLPEDDEISLNRNKTNTKLFSSVRSMNKQKNEMTA